MELHDAAALLEAEGLTFVITETKAPKGEISDGTLRVIRVRPQITQTASEAGKGYAGGGPGECTELTVCRI
jgi:hypothetical protein